MTPRRCPGAIRFLIFCLLGVLPAQAQRFVLPYPVQTASVQVQGQAISLAYTESGNPAGPPVVLVHGLGSYLRAWDRLVPWLSNYRVLCVDLPGYGQSSPLAQVSLQNYALAVATLLHSKRWPPAVWVGHSMGGQIALHAALQTPSRVKALALLAPAGLERFTAPEAAMLKAFTTPSRTIQASDADIQRNYALNFVRLPDTVQYQIADRIAMRSQTEAMTTYGTTVANSVAAMLEEPVADQLAGIKQPTLVLFGTQDALIPNRFLHPTLTQAQVLEAARAMPVVTVAQIEGAGHLLQLEQPTAVAQQLLLWLQQVR